MKLFETAWKDNHYYYERVFDTETNQSTKRRINLTHEWYEESSRGDYSFILDRSVKLTKHQGNSRDGYGQYGFLDPIYRNIKDNYWNKAGYNMNPRVWHLDIETRVGVNSTGFPEPSKAQEEVVLIQIYDTVMEVMIVIGSRPWYNEKEYVLPFKHQYIEVQDEVKLFETFFKIFKKLNPLIIYAWHGNGFDYPYLHNRIKTLGMDTNDLSNYGDVELKEKIFKGNTTYTLKSHGHYFIDLLDVYQKYTFTPQASYSLDATAEMVLGKKKVTHDEYAAFDDFYSGKYIIPTNPTPEQSSSTVYKEAISGNTEGVKRAAYSDFVYYGVIDAHLVYEIDQALNFTNLILMISQKMGVLVDDALGTVKPWAQYITNKALLNKQVMPKRTSNDEEVNIKGGYVRTPQVGKHSWVLSADVNSMYPLLGMVGFNMSPETFIPKYKLPGNLREYILRYYNDEDEETKLEIPVDIKADISALLRENKMSLGINGAVFSGNGLGMIPELVQEIYKSRKQAKQTMFSYEKRKLLIKDIIDEKMHKV